MRLIAAGLPLALMACAPTTPSPTTPAPAEEAQPVARRGLPAPTPSDAAVRVFAEDAGKTIAVPIGGRVSVALIGTPTAGYLWRVVDQPAFLGAAETDGGPTVPEQRKPGFAGGNHWETFTFSVTAAGDAPLRLEQRRPWETDEPAAQTFAVTIRAE